MGPSWYCSLEKTYYNCSNHGDQAGCRNILALDSFLLVSLNQIMRPKLLLIIYYHRFRVTAFLQNHNLPSLSACFLTGFSHPYKSTVFQWKINIVFHALKNEENDVFYLTYIFFGTTSSHGLRDIWYHCSLVFWTFPLHILTVYLNYCICLAWNCTGC